MDIRKEDLPTLFKRVRESKSLTVKEMSDILGLAKSTVSLYEAGKRFPRGETLLWYLSNDSPPVIVSHECPTCNGSGKIIGLRPDLFKVKEEE
jgi:transcriptional regulator with XRE-family HTH domain